MYEYYCHDCGSNFIIFRQDPDLDYVRYARHNGELHDTEFIRELSLF